jgi:hypothetical protein
MLLLSLLHVLLLLFDAIAVPVPVGEEPIQNNINGCEKPSTSIRDPFVSEPQNNWSRIKEQT